MKLVFLVCVLSDPTVSSSHEDVYVGERVEVTCTVGGTETLVPLNYS